ncbi:MAG: hypothetical protein Q9213_007106 [Squamulea squamosa]
MPGFTHNVILHRSGAAGSGIFGAAVKWLNNQVENSQTTVCDDSDEKNDRQQEDDRIVGSFCPHTQLLLHCLSIDISRQRVNLKGTAACFGIMALGKKNIV